MAKETCNSCGDVVGELFAGTGKCETCRQSPPITPYCPHCKEPLVVRCYYERWLDIQPIIEKGLLEANEHDCEVVHFSDDESDEFTDYECANCKENVADLIGNPLKGGENNG